MSKKETWIVTLNTNIGSGDKPASLYEPDFEKKFFAFDDFEDAKTKAFELIKSYAFSENSMFDGEGGIKRLKSYIEGNMFDEIEEDEDGNPVYLDLQKAYDIFSRWLNGEQIDLSGFKGHYEYDYKIEIIDGKRLKIQNASSLLYSWIITTDMMNITEPGNYSLYIRDNFDWDEDDPSILQVDIALAE